MRYLKCCLIGPSGSGKTRTGMELLKHIAGEPFSVIDTDFGRSSWNQTRFDFEATLLDGKTGFGVSRFVAAIRKAQQAAESKKFKPALLIDTLTQAWNGQPGGILKSVDEARGTAGDNTGWGRGGELLTELYGAIITAPLHVICTIQSERKQEQLGQDDRGQAIIRMIERPIYKQGYEYGFDCAFWLSRPYHRMTAAKITEPTPGTLLADMEEDDTKYVTKPGKEFAQLLKAWLDGEVA